MCICLQPLSCVSSNLCGFKVTRGPKTELSKLKSYNRSPLSDRLLTWCWFITYNPSEIQWNLRLEPEKIKEVQRRWILLQDTVKYKRLLHVFDSLQFHICISSSLDTYINYPAFKLNFAKSYSMLCQSIVAEIFSIRQKHSEGSKKKTPAFHILKISGIRFRPACQFTYTHWEKT